MNTAHHDPYKYELGLCYLSLQLGDFSFETYGGPSTVSVIKHRCNTVDGRNAANSRSVPRLVVFLWGFGNPGVHLIEVGIVSPLNLQGLPLHPRWLALGFLPSKLNFYNDLLSGL